MVQEKVAKKTCRSSSITHFSYTVSDRIGLTNHHDYLHEVIEKQMINMDAIMAKFITDMTSFPNTLR
ncbi:hypothetical protein pdam_00015984 [Pocillopora damicornis]|uniref:Uncharacterized protein n=1 Tax=Pocillopora damicornis TaxID=46731 RepID=A0A3M6TST8_POCDA|nr:hypothetical protein pdam_00015984 [Pocillopora damicornis]